MSQTRSPRQNLYLGSWIIFCVYMILLPVLLTVITPCMRAKPGSSFSYQNCNTVLVLDRFIALAIGGAGVLLIISFFRDAKRTYRRLLLTALIFSLSTISAYYLFAPRADRAIKKAPILLESLR